MPWIRNSTLTGAFASAAGLATGRSAERIEVRVAQNGRTIWIVDAHRDGKCFVVRVDEKIDCVFRTGIATAR
jgi:hypothetical protein